MCLFANGHAYNIISKEERKRVSNLRAVQPRPKATVDSNAEVKYTVAHCREDLFDAVMTSDVNVIYTTVPIDFLVIDLYQKEKAQLADRHMKSVQGKVVRCNFKGKVVLYDENAHDLAKLCKSIDAKHTFMTFAGMARQFFDSMVYIKMFESFLTEQTYELVRSAITSAIQFQGADPVHEVVCIDQRRAYTHSLASIENWLIADGDSEVSPCVITTDSDLNDTSMYYVSRPAQSNLLIPCEGLYTCETVRYALANGLIEKSNIVYSFRCKSVPYDFGEIISTIYDKCDDRIAKTIMNTIIGTFNDAVAKKSSVRYSFGKEADAIVKTVDKALTKQELTRPSLIAEDVYKIVSEKRSENRYTTCLMNVQIVQRTRLEIFKQASHVAKIANARIVQIKTDSFSLDCDDASMSIALDWIAKHDTGKIGSFKRETYNKTSSAKMENARPYKHRCYEQTKVEYDEDVSKLVDAIIENNRVAIVGHAGTGKTFLGRAISDEFIRRGYEAPQYCAYQNNVAEACDGKSLHKILSLDIDGKPNKRAYKHKILIVDEMSMIPRELWQALSMYYPDSIIIGLGDFSQLPPVNEWGGHREHSSMFKALFPYKLELTKVYRCKDPALMAIQTDCRNGNMSTVPVQKKIRRLDMVNICDTNVMRKSINDQVIKSRNLPSTHNIDNICESEKYKQNYPISKGLPLVRLSRDQLKNCALKDLPEPVREMANSSKWIITAIDGDEITMAKLANFVPTEITCTFTMNTKWFGHCFTPAYAITLYKAQGETLEMPHTIHEWERMKYDKRYAYTALTRAVYLKDVQIVL